MHGVVMRDQFLRLPVHRCDNLLKAAMLDRILDVKERTHVMNKLHKLLEEDNEVDAYLGTWAATAYHER